MYVLADNYLTTSSILSACYYYMQALLTNLTLEWQIYLHWMKLKLTFLDTNLPYIILIILEDQDFSVVSQEQLEYLRSLHFSWVNISRMLGISRMTLL